VSAAERRRGRRDNGLDASDWRAIDDLDPRVSEEVLAALGDRGIAAYVQPAVDVDPITRSATVPSRPSDRLYVDRQQVQAARDCLRGVLDRSPPATADIDAAFAGIVADFHRSDPTASPWPALEDAPRDREPAPEPEPEPPLERTRPVDARHLTESSLLDALDTFGTDLPDAEEPPETFVPPPPPPLPRLSRQAVLGTLAIVVGLVLLLGQPDLLPLDSTTMILLGFAMVLGGAVALILRLRPDPDEDEDPPTDDGAQV
jgi:hypothetical protein